MRLAFLLLIFCLFIQQGHSRISFRGGGSRTSGIRTPSRTSGIRSPSSSSFSRIRFSGTSSRFSSPSFSSPYRMSPTFRYRYTPVYSRWSIFYVYYGFRYYRPSSGSSGQQPIYANVTMNNLTVIGENIVLSQKYTKTKNNENDTVYMCGSQVSCVEPSDDYSDLIKENDTQLSSLDDLIDGIDGSCCEWTNGTDSSVCCYVYMINKASALKHIFISTFGLLFCSILLVMRLCK